MKNKVFLVACLIIFCSHDMYLKMDSYFLSPNEDATIQLYNGTFDKSENTIDRSRMLDVSLVGNGTRTTLGEEQWTEKDSITVLNFKSGDAGTWVAGVSTAPRNIELDAEAFNSYLEHDGVKDMLSTRKQNGTLEQDAVEKYSKHVKAIFQVGDERSTDWNTELGYPIEFVPLSNPYEAHTGSNLKVKLLLGGKPLANQLVYANYTPAMNGHSHDNKEHSHDDDTENHSHDSDDHSHSANSNNQEHTHDGSTHTHEGETEAHSHDSDDHSHSSDSNKQEHTHDGTTHSHEGEAAAHEHEDASEEEGHVHTSGAELRTDANGVVDVELSADGIWYLRTIHMVTTSEEDLTHESNWATLTFEVTHSHEAVHGDGHSHDEEDEFPSYIFWIGSIIILGGLFFWFSRKK